MYIVSVSLHSYSCMVRALISVIFILFFFFFFFSVRLLSVLCGHSFFIPATTANDLRLRMIFYTRSYPLHLFSYLNSWERDSIFPFECWVLNKGTTGTIFIKSSVWRGPWLGIEPGTPALEASTLLLYYRGGGPWLGIEPGTSRTRSQHYTTRLSRMRYSHSWTLAFNGWRRHL